ncbi:glycoside hydrolase domain-containing protein [Mangrovibacterium diazotrophicum]|uniref:Putative alpha-1,2-mannosidase n=1 Tax=Mangrovibacterium diazotrophicum TaxID=1261403 RepID=A0A419VXB9_9BACT|nr:glycoside hydrolase domain-containing protein [Mangrovibacterium diazotrophicum]RKD87819.1 putative alpha-1,2-mannosidase [Mangrovibacterium diazotrophicum]
MFNYLSRFRGKKILSLALIASLATACQESGTNQSKSSGLTDHVNVFLGTSGDHGQMSPSAAYPFSMLSIGPITTPHIHTGYEYYAKKYEGFVHTHLEGVGCTGAGGNILIKPILNDDQQTSLIRKNQQANPGYYSVNFENGIQAEMTVAHNYGQHHYHFPELQNGLFVDLSFTQPRRFVAEEHHLTKDAISGWIDTQTTCSAGVYRIYDYLQIPGAAEIDSVADHQFIVKGNGTEELNAQIGFSSVSTEYAQAQITQKDFEEVKAEARAEWEKLLGHVKVDGEKDRVDLFYSLLYRALQAPYQVSEDDGVYRAIDGSIQQSPTPIYNGWAIWDNYREQLPMLSLLYPDHFDDIAKSIANLYPYGKKNWATMHEPSPTVRTEHALVVLLDAWKKGYDVPLADIKDYLLKEAETLDYGAPDKALESSYDCWALSEILKTLGDSELSKKYLDRALEYKNYWLKDFADLSKNDIDRMQARGLYQGTIWQYRWFVPFDVAGLKELAGGEDAFISQLDHFFNENDYNHANQPDLQVPGMYNATKEPWKSQKLYRELLLDTVVQCYFNDNSKGVDPYVGRIYQNQPRAYLRTMDDDAGTMSSWFVMRSMGLSPANIGDPVYYLTAPVFKEITIDFGNGKSFKIKVKNYQKDNYYIQKASLNGKPLMRNWLTQKELSTGGELILETSDTPNKHWGTENQWISHIDR